MNKCLGSPLEATIITIVDASEGYCQIQIDGAGENKIGFTLHHSPLQYINMAFGLRNASGKFQRTKEVIMFSGKWLFALVYCGNIIVLSKTPSKRIKRVHKVLLLLHGPDTTMQLVKGKINTKTSAMWVTSFIRGAKNLSLTRRMPSAD